MVFEGGGFPLPLDEPCIGHENRLNKTKTAGPFLELTHVSLPGLLPL